MAARFLRKRGYRILARNVNFSHGEIDLLVEAPDKKTIVVVEVKAAEVATDTPPAASRPRPEVHVNHVKQRKLVSLAAQAVKRYRLHNRPVRFDVVGVDLPEKKKPVIRHHVGAFESHV